MSANKWKLDEKRFLKDVADHQMTILRDDGLYRHVRYAKPKSGDMSFGLVTWPGYLCYYGDMGEYVFSRIGDMFAFFRHESRTTGPLFINPGYWGEKCQAADRNGPLEKYSPDLFREAVRRDMKEMRFSLAARKEVAREVLAYADETEETAIRAAMDFNFEGFSFGDFYEHGCRDIGDRFLWCCYAISWGLRLYDVSKVVESKVLAS